MLVVPTYVLLQQLQYENFWISEGNDGGGKGGALVSPLNPGRSVGLKLSGNAVEVHEREPVEHTSRYTTEHLIKIWFVMDWGAWQRAHLGHSTGT